MTVRVLALIALLAAGPTLAQPAIATAPPIAEVETVAPPALEVDRPFSAPPRLIFISPAGEPFRADVGQAYPVAAWFTRADKNGDGVLTAAEFTADSIAFFDTLDTDKDGKVDGFENSDYEKTVAPEINGVMRRPDRRRGSGGSFWNPLNRGDAMWGRAPLTRKGMERDRSAQRQGAAQYGLLNEPHPVRGADADLDHRVTRAEAEAAALKRYRLLDDDGDGRLALIDLPQTLAQRVFEFADGPPPKP